MDYNKSYVRRDDQSTDCVLMLNKIETGEIFLRIHDFSTTEQMIVGFTNYIGGGRSPNVLKALENLAAAIEKDNKENSLEAYDKKFDFKEIEKNRLVINKLRKARNQKNGYRRIR